MNKEERKKYNQERYQKNKEEIKARNYKWRTENKEKHDASKAKWRAANSDREKRVNKEYRKNNPDKVAKISRAGHLRRKFGLSMDDYESMLTAQNNACAACRRPFSSELHACVDHCHATGVVRGLLCNSCNTSAGMSKDNAERLAAVTEYIRKHDVALELK